VRREQEAVRVREAEARAAAGAAHVDVGRPQTEHRDAARRALVRRQGLERNVELGRLGVPLGVAPRDPNIPAAASSSAASS